MDLSGFTYSNHEYDILERSDIRFRLIQPNIQNAIAVPVFLASEETAKAIELSERVATIPTTRPRMSEGKVWAKNAQSGASRFPISQEERIGKIQTKESMVATIVNFPAR
jgi:hypothetical protein